MESFQLKFVTSVKKMALIWYKCYLDQYDSSPKKQQSFSKFPV